MTHTRQNTCAFGPFSLQGKNLQYRIKIMGRKMRLVKIWSISWMIFVRFVIGIPPGFYFFYTQQGRKVQPEGIQYKHPVRSMPANLRFLYDVQSYQSQHSWFWISNNALQGQSGDKTFRLFRNSPYMDRNTGAVSVARHSSGSGRLENMRHASERGRTSGRAF